MKCKLSLGFFSLFLLTSSSLLAMQKGDDDLFSDPLTPTPPKSERKKSNGASSSQTIHNKEEDSLSSSDEDVFFSHLPDFIDNEDEIIDERFGILEQPGEFGFLLVGIPLSTIIADDVPDRPSGLERLQQFVEQQRRRITQPSFRNENSYSHSKLRLWRLRGVLGILPRTDSAMDSFERAGVDTILGTLEHFSDLLDPTKYIFSPEHISLTQEALLVQAYHLLRYRYEQGVKFLHFQDLKGEKSFTYPFKDLKPLLSGCMEMATDKSLRPRMERALETLAAEPWMQRLNFLATHWCGAQSVNLGAFLDENYITEFPNLSKAFPYQKVLTDIIAEHSHVLGQIDPEHREELQETISQFRRSLLQMSRHANIANLLVEVLEPMEDIADLEFDGDILANQVELPIRDFISHYPNALWKERDSKKFLLHYARSRLHDLGKGITTSFPKTYFQKDVALQPPTLRETFYFSIPFKLLHALALNLHHANMFKREDDIKRIDANIIKIRDFLREIIPYVKEFIITDLAEALDQPYTGSFKKENIKPGIDQILQRYPELQDISDFAKDFAHLFVFHMGNPVDLLPLPILPLTQWPSVMQDAFFRSLSMLGETAKGVTQNVKGMIQNDEFWKVIEDFRNELCHAGGLELELPLRFKTLFADDAYTGFIVDALGEMNTISQFFSNYCKALWENTSFPSPPTIHGHLERLMNIVKTCDLPKSPPPAFAPLGNRPSNIVIPPDFTLLRKTFEMRDKSLEERVNRLREELETSTGLEVNAFKAAIGSLFPLHADMQRDHDIIHQFNQLIGTRIGLSRSSATLSQYLGEIAVNCLEPNFPAIQNAIVTLFSVPDLFIEEAKRIFQHQPKMLKTFLNYQNAVNKERVCSEKIRPLLDHFNINDEFEAFINNFFTNATIKKNYDIRKKTFGDDAAINFLQTYLARFAITNWMPWVQAFKGQYGYIPSPEEKLYGHLRRAAKKAHELIQKIYEMEPTVADIRDERKDDLNWASVEYHLPQLRDYIDTIHLSIQRIRSLNPGLLRNIERQALSLRLMGNRLAHLNDAIDFEKHNVNTRHRDTNLVLQDIFGFTFGRQPTGRISFLDSLNFFVTEIYDILDNPRSILISQGVNLPHHAIEGQWIVRQAPNITVNFQERGIPKDGDCGFSALGFTREDAVQRLLDRENDASVRAAVAEDIRVSFLAGHFAGENLPNELRYQYYKHQTRVDSLRRQIIGLVLPADPTLEDLIQLARQDLQNYQGERAKLLLHLRKAISSLHEINIKIDAFTHDELTYKNFIRSEFIRSKRWLSYVRSGRGTLYALAQISGLDVRIWEPNPQHPGELRPIPLAAGLIGREVNLLHTNRLTHFNVLDPM